MSIHTLATEFFDPSSVNLINHEGFCKAHRGFSQHSPNGNHSKGDPRSRDHYFIALSKAVAIVPTLVPGSSKGRDLTGFVSRRAPWQDFIWNMQERGLPALIVKLLFCFVVTPRNALESGRFLCALDEKST